LKPDNPSISIVGLGYVGLCTAATFASKGFKTIGIDIDEERIEQIRKGKAPIHEPQLDRMLQTAVRKKLLEASNDTSRIVETSSTFLTVGTPSRDDGSIDLSYVKSATGEVGKALHHKQSYHLVVVKSTVIPGTTNTTVKPALEQSSNRTVGPELGLCANPEFLKEGTAIQDALHPDKIVIGASDKKSGDQLVRLYRRFYCAKLPPVIMTSPETAELVKYASNAFLATKVSYINTIANIAQNIPGVDVAKISEAIGHDPRIGPLFLKAGPGYGGSCFHKDLQALINYSENNGYNPGLLTATEQTNQEQAGKVVQLSEKLLGALTDKTITVLGIAFKKDTDDVREAASIRVIHQLREKGARVVAYDPMAMPNAKRTLGDNVIFAQDPLSAIKGADAVILMTEWDEFKKLSPEDYRKHMRTPNLVDARRIYNPEEYGSIPFEAVGLGPANPSLNTNHELGP